MTVLVVAPDDAAAPTGSAPGRAGRALLLTAVAACAACGLVYELVLLTLSTSLTGGGITQTSLIVAGYVAALGLGALLAKPFLHRAATTFVAVEIALGVAGGLSAVTLYVGYSFYGTSTVVLIVATLLLGGLVGAEVPLLMTLLQTGRRDRDAQSAGRVLANLNAADYAGAVLGGLAWPFLLLPLMGQVRGAAVTGLVNLLAAGLVAGLLLRRQMSRRAQLLSAVALLGAVALLSTLLVRAADIEVTARQRLYADPVVSAQRSDYQEVVLTERRGDLRLYLDGDLQFSSLDEYRYTEALVHPVLARDPERVLVLGGGDGLAARELLRAPSVREVVQVELDQAVLARLAPVASPRLRVLTGLTRAARWSELRPAGLQAVLSAGRLLAAVVVVDLAPPLEEDEELSYDTAAPRRNGAAVDVLRAADDVVVVGSADPVGLQRLVRGLQDLAAVVPSASVTVVVNRVRADAVGRTPAARVREALHRFAGVEVRHLVPDDRPATDRALLAGRTLLEQAPDSPARTALRELAEALLPGPDGGPRRGARTRAGRVARRGATRG